MTPHWESFQLIERVRAKPTICPSTQRKDFLSRIAMAAIRSKNSLAASGAGSTRPMIAQDSDRDLDASQSDADSDLWGSEATTSLGDQGERSSYEEHAIAKAETKAVRSLKLLVYLVLIVSAVAVSVGT